MIFYVNLNNTINLILVTFSGPEEEVRRISGGDFLKTQADIKENTLITGKFIKGLNLIIGGESSANNELYTARKSIIMFFNYNLYNINKLIYMAINKVRWLTWGSYNRSSGGNPVP